MQQRRAPQEMQQTCPVSLLAEEEEETTVNGSELKGSCPLKGSVDVVGVEEGVAAKGSDLNRSSPPPPPPPPLPCLQVRW